MNVKNPILPGFYPDPSVIRVEDTYYLVNSTFAYFPGIPVFKSHDLASWEQIGNVMERVSQLPLNGVRHSDGIYAPTIRYHEGTFYVICTNVHGGGNFVVTASDPAGPWSEPHYLPEAIGIDPSLFFDEDGSCWYIGQRENSAGCTHNGDCEIWIRRLDLETWHLTGEEYVVLYGFARMAIWPEGPHIYKKDGWYYIIHAEGGTDMEHSIMCARSRTLTGPYEYALYNPIFSHRHMGRWASVTCVGHSDLVDDGQGNWYMVMLACRPTNGRTLLGRETFLARVEWDNDWPFVNPESGMLEDEVQVADPPARTSSAPAAEISSYACADLPEKKDGVLLLSYDFSREAGALPLHMLQLRNPAPDTVTLRPEAGSLRLQLNASTLKDPASPAFAGFRQQTKVCTAETVFTLSRSDGSAAAGLVYLQDNDNHLRLEYHENESESWIQAVRCLQGEDTILGRVPAERNRRYAFRIRVEDLLACCEVKAADQGESPEDLLSQDDEWTTAAKGIALGFMGTEEAHPENMCCFTGTVFGMYGTADTPGSTADFYLYRQLP